MRKQTSFLKKSMHQTTHPGFDSVSMQMKKNTENIERKMRGEFFDIMP